VPTLLGRAKTVGRLGPTTDVQASKRDASSFALIDPRAIVQQVCERVRDLADAKDVDVIVHCACNRVWVQPNAFTEALYELVANAVEATRRGHPVIVDVSDTGEGDVLWQVQDAGKGTSERPPSKLRQPLHAEWQESSGLGVAFPTAVIENHGGILRFESAPGVGTTASILLPGQR
jgi:signal transduction histidine kinase